MQNIFKFLTVFTAVFSSNNIFCSSEIPANHLNQPMNQDFVFFNDMSVVQNPTAEELEEQFWSDFENYKTQVQYVNGVPFSPNGLPIPDLDVMEQIMRTNCLNLTDIPKPDWTAMEDSYFTSNPNDISNCLRHFNLPETIGNYYTVTGVLKKRKDHNF